MSKPLGGTGISRDPRGNSEPGGKRTEGGTLGPCDTERKLLGILSITTGGEYGEWGGKRENITEPGVRVLLPLYRYFRPDECCFLLIKPLSTILYKV